MYCPYHWKKGHILEQHVLFRKIIDEKHSLGEVLFQEGKPLSIDELPFPRRWGSCKQVSNSPSFSSRSRSLPDESHIEIS